MGKASLFNSQTRIIEQIDQGKKGRKERSRKKVQKPKLNPACGRKIYLSGARSGSKLPCQGKAWEEGKTDKNIGRKNRDTQTSAAWVVISYCGDVSMGDGRRGNLPQTKKSNGGRTRGGRRSYQYQDRPYALPKKGSGKGGYDL